jgi:hypothetical protein
MRQRREFRVHWHLRGKIPRIEGRYKQAFLEENCKIARASLCLGVLIFDGIILEGIDFQERFGSAKVVIAAPKSVEFDSRPEIHFLSALSSPNSTDWFDAFRSALFAGFPAA